VKKKLHFTWETVKKEFLILKYPIPLQRLRSIDHLFLACAVLQNMLIDYDGHDDWEECDKMKDIDDVESDVESNGALYCQLSSCM
jgi:hypothetical protein